MWLFIVGGRESIFYFFDVYFKKGDKNKVFGIFSGSVCFKLNIKGR